MSRAKKYSASIARFGPLSYVRYLLALPAQQPSIDNKEVSVPFADKAASVATTEEQNVHQDNDKNNGHEEEQTTEKESFDKEHLQQQTP